MKPEFSFGDFEHLSGAEYFAAIYGTERDKNNCYFFYKTGACRHGSLCYRAHNTPSFSRMVILRNFYVNPVFSADNVKNFLHASNSERDKAEKCHFHEVCKELVRELMRRYGIVDDLIVIDNVSEHLIGNVYVRFMREEDAAKAVKGLNDRWFNGQPIYAELSPEDIFSARCKDQKINGCTRGAMCNFLHIRWMSRDFRQRLGLKVDKWEC
ncbi:hypothetical protein L596_027003 [Steinernema carpocapsae]|uniref:C3H1-type domain-containing protein n=1 Tax=Steinernema carpocapsae TaxID=34508 RepID=A0A4U5M369_STECR|nr:hypothetical protein L596_027003 [Steinernema carpocapsae]